ncbi:MAG: general stress protein CsbD [bacterium]
MSKLEIYGCWHIFSGKLQQQWAKLWDNDNDLPYLQGRQMERLGRMQKRTGKSRAAVTKAVREAVYLFCCD